MKSGGNSVAAAALAIARRIEDRQRARHRRRRIRHLMMGAVETLALLSVAERLTAGGRGRRLATVAAGAYLDHRGAGKHHKRR
jgi:hypothetical protein